MELTRSLLEGKGRLRIFTITWLVYAAFYFCRKNLSIVLPALHSEAGLSDLALANIVFAYSLLYALGQFGCGVLSDRFGPKKVVGAGLVLIVASNLVMGLSATPLWLLVLACFNGIGQATGWSGLVKMMASWFRASQRGIVMAWWSTNYVLGGFLATAFATWAIAQHWLLPSLGWRRGFLFPALVVLGVSIAFFLFADNAPRDSHVTSRAASPRLISSFSDFARLLGNRALWLVSISYFFLELCRYAIIFWLPLYMVRRLSYSLETSGYLASLYELVGVTGALLAGYISDRLMQSRRAPVSALMLIGFALVSLLQTFFAGRGLVVTGFAISLLGMLTYGPDTLLSGAAAQDIGQVNSAATASGLIDGIGHLGSLFSPYLVVYVSQRYGWDSIFLVFTVAACAAAAMLIPLWKYTAKERFNRSLTGVEC